MSSGVSYYMAEQYLNVANMLFIFKGFFPGMVFCRHLQNQMLILKKRITESKSKKYTNQFGVLEQQRTAIGKCIAQMHLITEFIQ